MADYAAYIWSEPSSTGPAVAVTAHGVDRDTRQPADPVYQDRLPDYYDDADVIDAAGRSLGAAGWELTSYWTADDIGWRADVVRWQTGGSGAPGWEPVLTHER
ncbi:hypothetical protein [Nocardia gipuzkoensis]|uniref:hypothetical protein n=1 Tax=Nocardia gipuzkoensis TaxID=2749991 RepID=UPI00237EB3AD|nr:hypothetical protein [Nocardia gipuzkoensis]MDE1672669.1 hypothetical protein [Nocardia gipuzkoensis]